MKKILLACILLALGAWHSEASTDVEIKKGIPRIPELHCAHKEVYLNNMIDFAKEGDAEAAFCVGRHFEMDNTDENHEEKSKEWFLKAAALGSRKAQSLVAQQLESTNFEEAFQWRMKAAAQGDRLSLRWFAIFFYHRWLQNSEKPDLIQSYVMADLSGSVEIPDPRQDRNAPGPMKMICLESVLSDDQLKTAKEQASVMRRETPDLPVKYSSEINSCK